MGFVKGIKMSTMTYLIAAFMAIWVLLAIYLFMLASREKKLRSEIRQLKRLVEKSPLNPDGE